MKNLSKNLSKNILKIKNKKRKMKHTGKHRGGQGPSLKKNKESKNNTDELGSAFVNGYISILLFIKDKLARFAGLKPVEEEISSGPSLAEQGAETALNILNTTIQNPAVKNSVAVASENLAKTLGEIAIIAKDKLNDPEVQEALLLLVKFLAEMTVKFLDAISEPLNHSIDKYTDTFERLIRKMATALANAMLDFAKAIPLLGEAVAFVSLLHTIAMLIFSLIEAFYKTLNTTSNFVAQVSDNLNSSGAMDGFSKIKDILKPSIDKYTDLAKSKYQNLKTQTLQPTVTQIPVNAQTKNGLTPSLYPGQIQAYKPIEPPESEKKTSLSSSWNPFGKKGGNQMNENQMKALKGGRRRTQKRIQKTFRDYYKTNKTRRTRR